MGAATGHSSPYDLSGQVAVVTGASSGLGEVVARALAHNGARVAVVARRRERLEQIAKELDGLPVVTDLGDPEQAGEVIPVVVDEMGPPAILVSAAGGMLTDEKAEDEPLEAIMSTVRLNLVAPMRLSQCVFPHMVSAGGGSIVYISSISGQVGVPGIPQASYAASKSALSGLTRELAVQWARHSIRVNTVAPGFFRSEITEPLYRSERGREWLRRNTLLPIEGRVEDVLGAVLWLVSDGGHYVTGQTIAVDGGWTAK